MSKLNIIEGFEQAKAVLSRQASAEFSLISPAIKRKLVQMFGTEDPEQAVKQIINEVRSKGDKALFGYASRIDGVELTSLEATREQIAAAYQEVDKELISALRLAAEQIRSFHTAQKDSIWRGFAELKTSQMVRPLECVGVYAPGGNACYPSTVLMTAIPARVAGVKEVILATPPGVSGAISPPTLVAADIAQVDRVFCVGGAQAIAALAFGTESIPSVDKICGPGNIFVVLAKKMVYGVVDIDGLNGPSEVLIVADETADPEYCAADFLAQAEHDPLASAILVTTSRRFADKVIGEMEEQLKNLPRQTIPVESLQNQGKIIVVANIDEAIELANLYAPEHLCLMVDKAASYIDRVSNAGCVFVGGASTVVLGDYVAGPSHVLPTGGTARFGSPLNITDFIKFINLVTIDKAALKKLAPAASIIARAEGFEAHARAVEKRFKRVDNE